MTIIDVFFYNLGVGMKAKISKKAFTICYKKGSTKYENNGEMSNPNWGILEE